MFREKVIETQQVSSEELAPMPVELKSPKLCSWQAGHLGARMVLFQAESWQAQASRSASDSAESRVRKTLKSQLSSQAGGIQVLRHASLTSEGTSALLSLQI